MFHMSSSIFLHPFDCQLPELMDFRAKGSRVRVAAAIRLANKHSRFVRRTKSAVLTLKVSSKVVKPYPNPSYSVGA